MCRIQQKVEHDAPSGEQCSTYIDIGNPCQDLLLVMLANVIERASCCVRSSPYNGSWTLIIVIESCEATLLNFRPLHPTDILGWMYALHILY